MSGGHVIVVPDILAPGASVMTTLCPTDNDEDKVRYGSVWGTSFAAPIVTGMAALLIKNNPHLDPMEIRDALCRTSIPFDVEFSPDGRLFSTPPRAGRATEMAVRLGCRPSIRTSVRQTFLVIAKGHRESRANPNRPNW